MSRFFRAVLVLACFSVAALAAHAAEVKMYAAASLTDVLQALARNYEAQSGDKILFNFAGSNVLARQILQGAPADLFLSADEAQMDAVAHEGMIVNGSRKDLLSNTLVIVLPAQSGLSIQSPGDLAKPEFHRIAVGDPQMVPVGVYARSYLEGKGIWKSVESKITPTVNVRAALAAVASGDADAGIVYKTDALISKQVRVAYEVPVAAGPKILYPVALVKNSTGIEGAGKFLKYLESPKAAAVFAQYGFSIAGK